MTATQTPAPAPLFGLGTENTAYAKYFVGNSWLNMLTTEGVVSANVTFEPACRNNWHIHHKGGQILFVTDGRGWYREWGKPARPRAQTRRRCLYCAGSQTLARSRQGQLVCPYRAGTAGGQKVHRMVRGGQRRGIRGAPVIRTDSHFFLSLTQSTAASQRPALCFFGGIIFNRA